MTDIAWLGIDPHLLRREWVCVTALGGALAWIGTISAALSTFGIALALAPGVIIGLIVGYLQDQALVRHGILTVSTRWFFKSFVGGLLGWAAIFVIGIGVQIVHNRITGRTLASNPLLSVMIPPTAGAIFGAILGFFQWSSLRREGMREWGLANAAAWAVGATFGYYFALFVVGLAGLPSSSYLLSPREFAIALLGGTICTTIVAMLTGTVLVRLLQRLAQQHRLSRELSNST
jgi:hypothetical protein